MRKRTAILLCLFALLGLSGAAWGQPNPPPIPSNGPKGAGMPSPLSKNGKDPATEIYLTDGGHGGLSDWITYRRHGCGQTGWDPAVQTEVYVRSGVSFPFGKDVMGDVLNVGWYIQGGGKALFFDDAHVRAWFVDLSLTNIYMDTLDRASNTPISVRGLPSTLTEYNRTMVGLGAGRTWYLRGNGLDGGPNWRIGLDGGGRWGSASASFSTLGHTSDVVGGVYVGLQSDVEMPMPCMPCLFVAGLRGEWAYTWSDILDQPSDVQDFSILVHVGVRY
jgi:hypothetical protein